MPGRCKFLPVSRKGLDIFDERIMSYALPRIKFKRRVGMYKIEVDEEKCIGCEECVNICPVDVYEMKNEKSVPVNAEECIGCESCVEVCEQEAITVTEGD
jgi:NAD-dependent dihydropyrimidine dehydrogenase PreA subunit